MNSIKGQGHVDTATMAPTGRDGAIDFVAKSEWLESNAEQNAFERKGPESSVQASDDVVQALGQAVVRLWSNLPSDVQQQLFEAATTAVGQEIRQRLAIFLHEKHPRTSAALRVMPEPDSLGG
jgi:hypothetical protein